MADISTNLLPERARLESGDSFLVDAAAGTGRLSIGAAQNQLTRGVNILDNWYFANPINQRGQTEYTTTAKKYTIDRWFGISSAPDTALKVTIVSTGLQVEVSGPGYADFCQGLETDIEGMVTFSAIIDGNLYSVTGSRGTPPKKLV